MKGDQSTNLSQAEQSAGNVGLGFDGFEVKFGSSSADSNYLQWRSDFLATQYSEVADQLSTISVFRTASPVIANAIQKCLDSLYGTSVYITAVDDTQFVVFFRFKTPADMLTPATVKITGFQVSNATCTPSPASYVNSSLGPVQQLLCTKTDANAISVISMNTDQGGPDTTASYAPLKKPPSVAYNVRGLVYRRGEFVGNARLVALRPHESTNCHQFGTCSFTYSQDVDEHDLIGPIFGQPEGFWNGCGSGIPVISKQDRSGNTVTFTSSITCGLYTGYGLTQYHISYY